MDRSLPVIILFFILIIGVSAQSPIPMIIGSNQELIKNVEEVKVFPNPALDYIQISNNSIVKKVEIFNVLGKQLKSFQHFNNTQYDITDLRPGLYIIKMVDEKNKVVRSLRFNKNYDGA